MQLQAREKRILILGAIVATLLLAYLLWPRSAPRETSVELVPASQRPSPAPAAPAPVAPAPVQPVPVPQPVQAVPAAPAPAVPEGLKLTGVTGRSAIFAYPDGTQRLVIRGRDVAPGVVLQAVRVRDVILAVGPVQYRLGLGGVAIPIQPTAVATPAASPPPPVPPQPQTVAPAVVVAPPAPNASLAR